MAFGCRFPQAPQIITISKPPVFKPSKPSEIKSFNEAMAAIMTACGEDHLLVVDPIQLLLYKNTASFAAYGHAWTTLPIDVTDLAAEAQDSKIHINLEKIEGWGWAQLTDLLAHEYGHVIQYSLAGSEPKTTHWFREGFADWVAARVLQSLGWQDYVVTLHRAKLELIHSQGLLTGLRALDFQWGPLSTQSKGHIRTYTLAFVAMDRLIEMEGLAATLQYAKSGEFSASFHVSLENFEAEFDKYRANLKPSNNQPRIVMQKPDWNVGYQWTYAVKAPGARISTTKEVIREDQFEGVPAYVVKMNKLESYYSKETLERMAAMKDGKLMNKRYNPSHDLSWPLVAGNQWENKYTWEDFLDNSGHKTDLSMTVTSTEKITVPAGTFVAARIEGYDSKSGRLMTEYWYSPTTKWFIKTRTYNTAVPFIEEELTRFSVD
jgi:hypothetical protein